MKSFDDSQPNGLYRYKGLGEMDAKQLAESTLDINNRTLIRYTLEDAKAEINAIREYESDLSQLFKFTGSIKRQDLID
jgi:DNA gyrase/topoisomerase IV subunit B